MSSSREAGRQKEGQHEKVAPTTSELRQAKRLTLAPELENQTGETTNAGGASRASLTGGAHGSLLFPGPKVSDAHRGRRGSVKARCVSAHAAVSHAGCSAPKVRKINQDAVLVIEDWCKGLDAYWFCVLDGHGPAGHHVSSRVKQKLPTFVADAWTKHKDLKVALMQGYRSASEDLKQSTIDILCSGTTCVSCVLHGSTLYFANVGDSRAILGRGSLTDRSPWTAVPVTTDHKPELESERTRILAAGGRIAALQEDGEPCGPLRVWLATEDLPGLAMSRSLGDTLAAQAGVICEPDVGCVSLSSCDRFLLVASDGVWETISNEEALQIVKPFVEKNDPQKACHALIEKAQKKWLEEDGAVDDITCILAIFKW